MSPVIEYPEDLNPFDDNDDTVELQNSHQSIKSTESKKSTESTKSSDIKMPPKIMECDDYPQDLNPFGDDDTDNDVVADLPQIPSFDKSPKMLSKSVSLTSLNSTTSTLGRWRSMKKRRAPQPPKGVRPFSMILESTEKSF